MSVTLGPQPQNMNLAVEEDCVGFKGGKLQGGAGDHHDCIESVREMMASLSECFSGCCKDCCQNFECCTSKKVKRIERNGHNYKYVETTESAWVKRNHQQ